MNVTPGSDALKVTVSIVTGLFWPSFTVATACDVDVPFAGMWLGVRVTVTVLAAPATSVSLAVPLLPAAVS